MHLGLTCSLVSTSDQFLDSLLSDEGVQTSKRRGVYEKKGIHKAEES